jgi:hypothetical protein
LQTNSYEAQAYAFSSDGHLFATTGSFLCGYYDTHDRSVTVWDTATGAFFKEFSGQSLHINCGFPQMANTSPEWPKLLMDLLVFGIMTQPSSQPAASLRPSGEQAILIALPAIVLTLYNLEGLWDLRIETTPESGSYLITFNAMPCTHYTLRSSTDLRTWSSRTNIPPASTSSQVQLRITSSEPTQFFQLIEE